MSQEMIIEGPFSRSGRERFRSVRNVSKSTPKKSKGRERRGKGRTVVQASDSVKYTRKSDMEINIMGAYLVACATDDDPLVKSRFKKTTV